MKNWRRKGKEKKRNEQTSCGAVATGTKVGKKWAGSNRVADCRVAEVKKKVKKNFESIHCSHTTRTKLQIVRTFNFKFFLFQMSKFETDLIPKYMVTFRMIFKICKPFKSEKILSYLGNIHKMD